MDDTSDPEVILCHFPMVQFLVLIDNFPLVFLESLFLCLFVIFLCSFNKIVSTRFIDGLFDPLFIFTLLLYLVSDVEI